MILKYAQWAKLHEAKGIFSGGLLSPDFDLEKKKGTVAFRLLTSLYRAGDLGMSYRELQKRVLELQGKEWNPGLRGYWSTNLSYQGKGLLDRYAERNSAGRWVLKPEARATFVRLDKELTTEDLVKISKSSEHPVIRRAAELNPNFPEDLTAWALGSGEDSWL